MTKSKQETRMLLQAIKPRNAAIRNQNKQLIVNLTPNGQSRSFKVTRFEVSGKAK